MIMGRKEYDILKVGKIKEMFRDLRYIRKNDTMYTVNLIGRKVVIRTLKWIEG